MTGPQPRTSIQGIAPYIAGKASAPGVKHPIKLSANENVLGASPAAIAAYREAAAELHLYPDPNATALREALAAKHDLDPARIILGTGSDELFSMACIAYLEPGDTVVQPAHGFAAWAIAARAVGGIVKNASERGHTADVSAILDEVDARTRIVFIANPANPTGTWLPFSEIERLHAALPEHVLLVLDEAYIEFARDQLDTRAGLALAARAANVLTTRTFSKLHGLAALRIGWGYANAQIIEPLNRFRLPFNTPRPAQAGALAALGDEAFIEQSLALAESARGALSDMLRRYGLTPLLTATNFVTARAPTTLHAGELEARLAAEGVLVRHLKNYGMPDFLRFTIGTDAQMAALDRALGLATSRR